MTTLFRFDGLRVTIYGNDHAPAHVHVVGGGREVIFELNCPGGPVELRKVRGSGELRSAEANRMRSVLTGRLGELCAKWRTLHGDYR